MMVKRKCPLRSLLSRDMLIPVGTAVAFLLVGAIANAQAPGVPNPDAITSPTGFERIPVENPGPYIAIVELRQMRDAVGYQTVTQAATNVLGAIASNVSEVDFTGATSGTATLTTPANPKDGQHLDIFTAAGLTTVTITANTGQTISNAVTALAALSSARYTYNLATTTWVRSR